MKHRLLYVILALALVAAACGDDDDGGGGGADSGGETPAPQVEKVQLAIDTDDYMNNLAWVVADERYWPELGFEEPAEVFATDEYIPGLLGGDVWVAQGESDVIWAALDEGSVPLKIVGVEKDTEAWFIGVRRGSRPRQPRRAQDQRWPDRGQEHHRRREVSRGHGSGSRKHGVGPDCRQLRRATDGSDRGPDRRGRTPAASPDSSG